MAQRGAEVTQHLSADELRQRYKAAEDAQDARRWQVVWLVTQGRSTKEVAEVAGITQRSVRRIVARYNTLGPVGVEDRRPRNAGRRRRLTDEQHATLLTALKGRAPDGGLWTGPKVAAFGRQQFGLRMGATLGWVTLKRLGGRLVAPRRRHQKAADDEEQEAWKDRLACTLERTRRDALLIGARVEVWAQDEARLGLKPVVRRVWRFEPGRPLARTWHKYEWLYVYGFVHPSSGRTHWLILPCVDTELMSLALEEFAREVGAGRRTRILLVIDQAGWHISGEVRVPEGIELVPLPPYTPELQPAERLWPLLNEAIANEAIASLDELETELSTRCCALLARPQEIQAVTNYHWWPKAA